VIRAVLDTNVVVSALLFDGQASRLLALWQQRRFIPVISRPILQEYLRVLAYPKFKLTAQEVRDAIEQLLPYAEVASPSRRLRVIRRDPDDNRFLECVVAAKAQYLVSGDDDLLSLGTFQGIRVVSVAEFLAILEGTAR
jgi:putative PIN family toxin of toxin-antitoxin system